MAKVKTVKPAKGRKIKTVNKIETEVITKDKPLIEVRFTDESITTSNREYSVLDVKIKEDKSVEEAREVVKQADITLNKAVALAVNDKLKGVAIDNDGVIVQCKGKCNMFNIVIDVEDGEDSNLITYINMDDFEEERKALDMFNLSK